jgi:hypothetical protein
VHCRYGGADFNAGKSIGVLRSKKLRCQGPHHFTAKPAWAVGQPDLLSAAGPGDPIKGEFEFDWRGTHVLPPSVAVTLHYESCTYDRCVTSRLPHDPTPPSGPSDPTPNPPWTPSMDPLPSMDPTLPTRGRWLLKYCGYATHLKGEGGDQRASTNHITNQRRQGSLFVL